MPSAIMFSKDITEINPWQAVREIAFQMKVSHPTIIHHLAQIGRAKKMDKWISRYIDPYTDEDS